MDFPDMNSLIQCAKIWKFRQPNEGEPEVDYRKALSDHIAPQDFIESQEVRAGKGWDKWNKDENHDMLMRSILRSI